MTRDIFEAHAKRWWPEIDLERRGDSYSNSQTSWMYEGWLLATTAAIEALRGKE
jgi:hypothetical protein